MESTLRSRDCAVLDSSVVYRNSGYVDHGDRPDERQSMEDILLPPGVQANEEDDEPVGRRELERQVEEAGILMPTSFWDREYAPEPSENPHTNILLPPGVGR